MSIKSEYKSLRKNLLSRINYASRQYGINKSDFIPSIPKKITAGSINRLKLLDKKLSEKVHEVKVDTGYYIKQRRNLYEKRRQKNISDTSQYLQDLRKLTEKAKKKGDNVPTPAKNPDFKTPPNLTDITLKAFESEMETAKNFISEKDQKIKTYENTIREAGRFASNALQNKINELTNKYIPDLTKDDVRKAVSKKFNEKYTDLMTKLDSFLYEFISDGQGHLEHTAIGISQFEELLNTVSDTKISVDDMKELNKLADDNVTGNVVKGIGEEYDY